MCVYQPKILLQREKVLYLHDCSLNKGCPIKSLIVDTKILHTTTMSESYQSKSVCVIGAGPSGLVAARELKKEGHRVVVLEQNHDVGGQWLYNPNVEEEDPLGRSTTSPATVHSSPLKVHSSVYQSLRIGSPREIMGFTDFPFAVKKDI